MQDAQFETKEEMPGLGLDEDEDESVMITVEFPDRDGTGKKQLEIPKDAARGSILFGHAMDFDNDFASGASPFPLDTLKDGGSTEFEIEISAMQHIIEYLVQHKGQETNTLEKPLPYDNINELVDK